MAANPSNIDLRVPSVHNSAHDVGEDTAGSKSGGAGRIRGEHSTTTVSHSESEWSGPGRALPPRLFAQPNAEYSVTATEEDGLSDSEYRIAVSPPQSQPVYGSRSAAPGPGLDSKAAAAAATIAIPVAIGLESESEGHFADSEDDGEASSFSHAGMYAVPPVAKRHHVGRKTFSIHELVDNLGAAKRWTLACAYVIVVSWAAVCLSIVMPPYYAVFCPGPDSHVVVVVVVV
jgi:hypothetical protein